MTSLPVVVLLREVRLARPVYASKGEAGCVALGNVLQLNREMFMGLPLEDVQARATSTTTWSSHAAHAQVVPLLVGEGCYRDDHCAPTTLTPLS